MFCGLFSGAMFEIAAFVLIALTIVLITLAHALEGPKKKR